jgi:small subunit ribosomal protein S16
MKKMGRKHRPFFRICAIDRRSPRDGRVLEELGTYDPMVNEVDARALLKSERIDYWLGVGAQPSDKVKVLIKKYGSSGSHLSEQQAARERLSMPKVVPEAGEPVYVTPSEEPAAEAPAAEAPAAEAPAAKAPAAEAPAAEAPAADEAAAEAPAEAPAAAESEAKTEPAAESKE